MTQVTKQCVKNMKFDKNSDNIISDLKLYFINLFFCFSDNAETIQNRYKNLFA